MVPHCSEFLIPVLHCCSTFLLNSALCLPYGSQSAKDQCVASTHQSFSSIYRSILFTCSPADRNLSVVVRLLWSSEDFQSLLFCTLRFRHYTFDHTLAHSLKSPRIFHFLFHKRWCEHSLNSFSLHLTPESLILLFRWIGNLRQCLFRVAELLSGFRGIRLVFSANALPCFSIHMITWSDWHCCVLFSCDHTFWAKVYRFFSCWSFQSFFRISFSQDHLFLWLQLLISVFTPTHTLRSLSLLFIFNKLNMKCLGSARFILPVTGNRTYSEFLSHPCLYICNSFSFCSTLLLLSIWTYSAGALLQLCTVCIERPSYSFAWIGCSFAKFFHPSVCFSLSFLPTRAGFPFCYFTEVKGAFLQLFSLFLRGSGVTPVVFERVLRLLVTSFSFVRHLHFLHTLHCRSFDLYFDPV
jgi:hypothetical protein